MFFKKTFVGLSFLCFSFVVVLCVPPLEPSWDSKFQSIFEAKQKALANQHISKIQLKSSSLYLPGDVTPISYDLKICPILESEDPAEIFTAPGSLKIVFKCISKTDSITLHAQTKSFVQIFENTVKVTPVNVLNEEKRVLSILGHSYESADTDFYTIRLADLLVPGVFYNLEMKFQSKISTTTLDGLYLSKYKDPLTNETKYLATTQFEDIAARNMFPCFDEPDLKATFKITISRLESYNSMSNMQILYSEPDPDREGYVLDFYETTPKMSTYLLAIIVSSFTCKSAPASLFRTPVEACGPEYLIEAGAGDLAAKVSASILQYYDDQFEFHYPLPKMQSVAIPDFDAGAMENYGLCTYRIEALMYLPELSTTADKYSVELIIAHELAHQNFGNLVTCKTWNQIFLNEGFATFVSYLGMGAVSPEITETWYTGFFQNALRTDASIKSHPLVKVNSYFGDFDGISYSKGASIIKMMESIITPETLKQALRVYIKTYAFKTSHYQNLYETLDEQARLLNTHPGLASMSEIMEGWTINPGFPLIRVQQVFERMFYVTQERFLNNRDDLGSNSSYDATTWYVPIFIATSVDSFVENSGRPQFWLTDKELTKSFNVPSSLDWLIVNVDSSAFARVSYDDNLNQLITKQLQRDLFAFGSTSRAQLIDDGFELAATSYSSIKVALDRTIYLGAEPDSQVWSTVSQHFRRIQAILSNEPEKFDLLRNYLSPRVESALRLIGLEKVPYEKNNVVLHRKTLLAWGTVLKTPTVLQYAIDLLDLWKLSPDSNPVPIDLRSELYCSMVLNGNEETLEFFLKGYLKNFDPQLIFALGCSEDAYYLTGLLNGILDPSSEIPSYLGQYLLRKIAGNSVSRVTTYWFIRDNYEALSNLFGSSWPVLDAVSAIASYCYTEEQLALIEELQPFVDDNAKLTSVSAELPTLPNIKNHINSNMRWWKFNGEGLLSWLQSREENNK